MYDYTYHYRIDSERVAGSSSSASRHRTGGDAAATRRWLQMTIGAWVTRARSLPQLPQTPTIKYRVHGWLAAAGCGYVARCRIAARRRRLAIWLLAWHDDTCHMSVCVQAGA
jgi:hypothetical protein